MSSTGERGVVDRVVDGDTVVFNGQKVRLNGIDAPELRQAYGQESKQQLEQLIFGTDRPIFLHVSSMNDRDRYKRRLGTLTIGPAGTNINLEMIRLGAAWHYAQYDRKNIEYAQAQQKAMRKKRGLWASEDAPRAPWDWRKQKRLAHRSISCSRCVVQLAQWRDQHTNAFCGVECAALFHQLESVDSVMKTKNNE